MSLGQYDVKFITTSKTQWTSVMIVFAEKKQFKNFKKTAREKKFKEQ